MNPEELKLKMYLHRHGAASVPKMAERLGVSRTMIYLVRDGKATSYRVAREIAASIGLTVEEAFPGKYKDHDSPS